MIRRFDDQAVQEIRQLYARRVPMAEIARRFDSCPNTILRVVRRLGPYAPPKPKPKKHRPKIRRFDPKAAPVWCEPCKAMVRPPCLACQIRALPPKRKAAP